MLFSGTGEYRPPTCEIYLALFKSNLLLIFRPPGLMLTEPLPTDSLLGIFSKCHHLDKGEIWGAFLLCMWRGRGDKNSYLKTVLN